ncbi:muscular LMNA-interacting protein isoform X2 [Eleutherodactylus coqui]|uniref:muscular LMNA-interacting protein isoform X2 n=1 Tax=Eleutherodactylus coqui TaxID=57060 RepID=UPI003462DD72
MDFEKKNKTLLDKTLGGKSMASPTDRGTMPLAFTFVPSIGTLPSEVLLTKESNHLPKIVGHKETWMQKPEDAPEKLLEKNMQGSPESNLDPVHKGTSPDSFLQSTLNNSENIKHSDLFIAEFVVVMDSDEEREIIAKKSQNLPFEEGKCEFRETLQRSTAGRPRATLAKVNANEIYGPGSQEDYRNVGGPEPQQIYPGPTVGLDSYSPQSPNFTYPDKTTLGYKRQNSNPAPTNIHKPKTTAKDTFHTPLSPQKSNSLHILTTESPVSPYPRRSLYSPTDLEMAQHKTSNINQSGRSNVLSPLPIQVIKYPLCRSPSPLSSSFFGSSSTICSMNESTSPVPKPRTTSPVSSRLSFLTSLLKSNRSCAKRTISPDHHYQSEPKTIFLTNSDFQKSSVTPDAPRKAISCFSLNHPRESKMPHFQRKAEFTPSASESDILHGRFSFQQSPNRTLSPDSIHFKSSASGLLSQKGSVSPSSQLRCRSITPPHSGREYVLSLTDKPPINRLPYTPIKKYSVLGKSKRVTLFPPPLHFDQSPHHFPEERKSDMPHLKRYTSSRGQFRSISHAPSENSQPRNLMPCSSTDIRKNHGHLQTRSCNENMETNQDKYQSQHSSYPWQPLTSEELLRKKTPLCSLPTNITAQPRSILSRSCELPSEGSLSQFSDLENNKLHKNKSKYKAFAAIPTNTLLLDQKAIDESEINRRNSDAEDRADTHTEMCSPALLRQQTEEICAAIDEVLHDPFPMHSKSASRSPKLKFEKKSAYMPRPPLKSAGRETKYATLQSLINTTANDPQATRPGVIRPLAAKPNQGRRFYPNLFQPFSMPPYEKE